MRVKSSDIIDWLADVEGQVRADAYQQNENTPDELWFQNQRPPDILWIDGNKMMVEYEGDKFLVTVTKKRSKL